MWFTIKEIILHTQHEKHTQVKILQVIVPTVVKNKAMEGKTLAAFFSPFFKKEDLNGLWKNYFHW